ncbi:hypothetical protein PsorP6_017890 [Peronosclerospora sorghi]|uniref:Uncharacterized protein n=1 Tax=Peronosclerospora sorghi TaxID=230839 RepID=A0ACC0WBU6_9STRA|nr:hypothetical protein PsorP6_017890 [Peronosclerospora sorghi]
MALRQNPYAIEAALALTKLAVAEDACLTIAAHGAERSARFTGSTTSGVSQHEIEKFYQTTATIGEIEDSELSPRLDVTWRQTLRQLLQCVAGHDFLTNHIILTCSGVTIKFSEALESFKFLDRVFPTNLHCLLHKAALEIGQEQLHQAALEIGQEQLHQAHVTFKRIRQIEDLNISFMDHYANCLRKENLRTELADLVQQLFSITSTCPESGIITSYCELFAVGVKRYKEAFTAAKSVVKIFPTNAQSLVLLGNVLALNPDNREQARKVLQKALAMEPQKLSKNFALFDLLVEDGNLRAAIDALLDLGEHQPREEVFTNLADV